MAKTLIQLEGRMMTVAAPYALTSGQGAQVGVMFGVAQSDAANGAEVVLDTQGVYDVTKLSTDTPTVGVALYWDNTNKRLTTTASTHIKVGVAAAAAGSGVATVPVRLNGSF